MGMLISSVIAAVLGVLTYYALQKVPMIVKRNVFIAGVEPTTVYNFMKDAHNMAKIHYLIDSVERISHMTDEQNIEHDMYRVISKMDHLGSLSYNLTITADPVTLNIHTYVSLLYGTVNAETSWTFATVRDDDVAGTLFTEHIRYVTCRALTSFVRSQNQKSHDAMYETLKLLMEGKLGQGVTGLGTVGETDALGK